MKCRECPGYQYDGESICLMMYPEQPAQLLDEDEEADYCTLWEEYKERTGTKELWKKV